MNEQQNIIIYNTADGKASVSLYAKDGMVWMNQNQLAELFATSVPNISIHTSNIFKEKELEIKSVVKDYLTTASDGKEYNVTFYSLDMVLAIGFRVRSKRGTQFRIWANRNLKSYLAKGYSNERSKNIEVRTKMKSEKLNIQARNRFEFLHFGPIRLAGGFSAFQKSAIFRAISVIRVPFNSLITQ